MTDDSSPDHGRPPREFGNKLRKSVREWSQLAYSSAILDQAQVIFVRDGLREAKMADIAAAAEISVGTLYNYFQNKEALVLAIIERNHRVIWDQLERPYDCNGISERLLEFANRLHHVWIHERHRLQLFLQWGNGQRISVQDTRFDSSRSEFISTHLRIHSNLNELLRHGVRNGELRDDISVDFMGRILTQSIASIVSEWDEQEWPPRMTRLEFIVAQFLQGAALQSDSCPKRP